MSIKVVVAAKKWKSVALKSHAARSFVHAGTDAAASDVEAAKQARAEAEKAAAAAAFAGAGAHAQAQAGSAGGGTPPASAPDEAALIQPPRSTPPRPGMLKRAS